MSSSRHLHVVDLVRFCCAIAVLAFHYASLFAVEPDTFLRAFASGGDAIVSPRWHDVAWFGWVGVDVFFVISGYVIATSSVGVGTEDFVRRRVLRLAPTAWICATITASVLLIGSSFSAVTVTERWLAAMAFYPIFQPIDPSYWSLSVEACFYLVVALLLRGEREGLDRQIQRLGMVLAVASTAYWMISLSLQIGPPTGQRAFALNLMLLPHGLLFALGILLSAADRHGWTGRRRCAAAALVAAAAAKQVTQAMESHATIPIMPALFFTVMVIVIIMARRAQPWMQRIPYIDALRTIGLMTYPLYLLHQALGAACLVELWRMGVSSGTAILITTGAMLLLALVVTVWVEPVVRAALKTIMASRAPRPDTRRNAFPSGG